MHLYINLLDNSNKCINHKKYVKIIIQKVKWSDVLGIFNFRDRRWESKIACEQI